MKLDLCTLTRSDSWMISGSQVPVGVSCFRASVVSSVTGSVTDAGGGVIPGVVDD